MFSWCTRVFPRKPCPLGIPVDKISSRNWKVEVYLRRSMPPGREHAPWSGIVAVTMAQLTAVGEKKEEKDKKGRYQGQRNKRDAKIEQMKKKERKRKGRRKKRRKRTYLEDLLSTPVCSIDSYDSADSLLYLAFFEIRLSHTRELLYYIINVTVLRLLLCETKERGQIRPPPSRSFLRGCVTPETRRKTR